MSLTAAEYVAIRACSSNDDIRRQSTAVATSSCQYREKPPFRCILIAAGSHAQDWPPRKDGLARINCLLHRLGVQCNNHYVGDVCKERYHIFAWAAEVSWCDYAN
jgi:hypothetical protein